MADGQTLPPPIWVDTPAGFRSMLAHLQGEPAIALDTESNSLYVYHEQVCLIQLSTRSRDYLLDPLALRDLSGLGPLLADPARLKVLHGAEYDLSVLDRDYGFRVANLFDTMWASRILGWPSHGLGALIKTHFGTTLEKRYQRANWGVRPLPPEQLDYARLDSHYLLPLYAIQAKELEASDRWRQARHRFGKVAQTRWQPREFDADGFWRLPGAREMDDEGRGVLRALYVYRDRQAQAENRPPFKVLNNRTLAALGERRPWNMDGLRQVKGISPRMARKYGKGLLAAIREGRSQPLSLADRPRTSSSRTGRGAGGRPSAACQARFDALRAWRNETAAVRHVEPDIVLTNQTLWAVAHRNPRRIDDLGDNGLLAPWQVDEFGDDLLAVLRGQR